MRCEAGSLMEEKVCGPEEQLIMLQNTKVMAKFLGTQIQPAPWQIPHWEAVESSDQGRQENRKDNWKFVISGGRRTPRICSQLEVSNRCQAQSKASEESNLQERTRGKDLQTLEKRTENCCQLRLDRPRQAQENIHNWPKETDRP